MKKIIVNKIPMEVYNTQNPNDLEFVLETCLEYHNEKVRESDPYNNEVADYTQEIKAIMKADTILAKWKAIINSNLFHDAVGELVDFSTRSKYEIWVVTETYAKNQIKILNQFL